MPTTVPAAFAAFKSKLEITALQALLASTRQKAVRAAVAEDFVVLSDFLTGSYCRRTMIAPLSEADIDVFVVLHPDYYKAGGYATLLDSVKTTLKKTYTTTPAISRNGQAVTITFSGFRVDVVPGFNRKNGGFLIPDTYGKRWISTDPKKHIEMSAAKNNAHNGDLVPLVKMVKQWNKTISFPFRSFHLEVLAWSIFEGVKISNLSSGVRYFFDKGRELVATPINDPAGYGGNVGSYVTDCDPTVAAFAKAAGVDPAKMAARQSANAVTNFETAFKRAFNAEQYAKNGQNALAFAEWRKLFGDKFPAYS